MKMTVGVLELTCRQHLYLRFFEAALKGGADADTANIRAKYGIKHFLENFPDVAGAVEREDKEVEAVMTARRDKGIEGKACRHGAWFCRPCRWTKGMPDEIFYSH